MPYHPTQTPEPVPEDDDPDDDFKDENGVCRCDECETYFNEDVKRPITKISKVDHAYVLYVIGKPEIAARIRKHAEKTCQKHSQNTVVICKLQYGEAEGGKCIAVDYKNIDCMCKRTILIGLDDPATIDINTWGLCNG